MKHRNRRHDQHTAYKNGTAPAAHKVAVERSKKALKKKAYPMT
ncbi:MAG: hypothetical protein ACO3A2_04945 [Bdellovibrionia bacterium]